MPPAAAATAITNRNGIRAVAAAGRGNRKQAGEGESAFFHPSFLSFCSCSRFLKKFQKLEETATTNTKTTFVCFNIFKTICTYLPLFSISLSLSLSLWSPHFEAPHAHVSGVLALVQCNVGMMHFHRNEMIFSSRIRFVFLFSVFRCVYFCSTGSREAEAGITILRYKRSGP